MASDAFKSFSENAIFRGCTFEPNSVPLVVAVKGEQQVGELATPQEFDCKTRQITDHAGLTVPLHLSRHNQHTDLSPLQRPCETRALPRVCTERLQL
jgi:hypothetical protein